MGVYTKLAENIDEVDIIIAGGRLPIFFCIGVNNGAKHYHAQQVVRRHVSSLGV